MERKTRNNGNRTKLKRILAEPLRFSEQNGRSNDEFLRSMAGISSIIRITREVGYVRCRAFCNIGAVLLRSDLNRKGTTGFSEM